MKDALWSLVVFFGILMVIGYINGGTAGMKNMLTDPINWLVLIIVVVISIFYQKRREDKATGNE
ncbi:hypothetical protein NC796_22145 [Aliifodinibius sp. S!AR15-10]|nr:hypothetical protein [Aliifodinibius sp. S!AR15-10]